jgi:hypothetical protein
MMSDTAASRSLSDDLDTSFAMLQIELTPTESLRTLPPSGLPSPHHVSRHGSHLFQFDISLSSGESSLP